MTRVVFVVPHMGIGGVERSLSALLRAAPHGQFELTLLLFQPGGVLLDQIPDGIHIQVLPGMKRCEGLRAKFSTILRKPGLRPLFTAVKRLYHRFGPGMAVSNSREYYDVAVAYADGLATWYVAQSISAARKVAFVHTDFAQARYSAAVERKNYACFERIFFVSGAAQSSFLAAIPELAGKAAVLHSAVDTDEVRRLATQPGPLDTDGFSGLRLLTVGRLSHEKGIDKIPGLLSKLRSDGVQVRWYIAGDGPERAALLSESRRLGLQDALIFLGNLDNPYSAMRACDIYVQPSNYEGYCIALAEARALCKPIVACDFAGAREQVKDGLNGFITGMSIEELYSAVVELVNSPQKRSLFSKALFEQQTDLDDNSCTQKWWEWLGTI